MSFYTPSKLPDVATETITSLGQSIDLVGMTNIQLPIMIEVQNEVKTDKKPEKINQEVNLLNKDDKTKETEASTEKNKTLDSDTASK